MMVFDLMTLAGVVCAAILAVVIVTVCVAQGCRT